MGIVHSIATGKFIAKNKKAFYEGLEGYGGGEFDTKFNFVWSGGSKKGNNVEIELTTWDFSRFVWKLESKDKETGEIIPENFEDSIDVLEYIQNHLADGEEMIIHHVEYEHPSDMCIYKYIITNDNIEEIEILNQ